jgi:hypothetical protein
MKKREIRENKVDAAADLISSDSFEILINSILNFLDWISSTFGNL